MTDLTTNPYNNQSNSNLSNIGSPIFCFTKSECVLKKNEIWLEGALVKIETYPLLFKEYGYNYTPEGAEAPPEGYFYAPDYRNRSIWGSSDGKLGYLEATLPNIRGEVKPVPYQVTGECEGAFERIGGAQSDQNAFHGGLYSGFSFNASRSNPIYQDNATVRPPSIKCRVKTRYR